MKTLKEHNDERRAAYDAIWKSQQPHPNGIACPKCGKELWDSNPTMTLASNPPQKNVHCPACGHHDYRLV